MILIMFKKLYRLILPSFFETRNTAAPITFRSLFFQKVLRINANVPWPTHFTSRITHPENIEIGIGTAPGLSPGCYIQGIGKIIIGDYTLIGPNVGIISGNHNIYNIQKHEKKTIKIGSYSWIGMNAVILPGVILGNHTIVAAGAVVNKSFPEGFIVIGGTPARIVKYLDKKQIKEERNEFEYKGYKKVVND